MLLIWCKSYKIDGTVPAVFVWGSSTLTILCRSSKKPLTAGDLKSKQKLTCLTQDIFPEFCWWEVKSANGVGSWVWDTVRNYFKNVKVTFPLFQRQCLNKRQNILVLFFSASILNFICQNLICTNQNCLGWIVINRGYYKVTRGYEISFRVLKNISRVSAVNEWNFFQHKKRNFVSPSTM